MAAVKRTTRTRVVETEEPAYTLTLSPEEAKVLVHILSRIGGCPSRSPRRTARDILWAFDGTDVVCNDSSIQSSGDISFKPYNTSSAHSEESEETRPIQGGDWVRVVEDDPHARTGEYIGRVGRVIGYWDTGSIPYCVSFGDGSGGHGDRENGSWWWCNRVERVTEPPESSDSIRVGGTVYDVNAKYKDIYGDIWTLRRLPDCTVRGGLGSSGIDENNRTWADAVNTFGPMTKVDD